VMHPISECQFVLNAEMVMSSQPVLGVKEVIKSVIGSLDSGNGFSLIRIGDGEGRLLGYRHNQGRDAVDFILKTWFGTQRCETVGL